MVSGPNDQTTRWCPQCGDEYRAGYEVCSECGVPLVAELTHTARPRVGTTEDHDQVEYEFGDWPASWRESMEFLVRGANIPFQWDTESTLVVPRVREAEVDKFADFIESPGEERASAEMTTPPEAGVWRRGAYVEPGPASALRRLGAYLLDGFFRSLLFIPVFGLIGGRSATRANWALAFLALDVLYTVPSTAAWGRTIGKLIVGIRVEAAGADTPPGWRASVVRFAVPEAPSFVTLFMYGWAPWIVGEAWKFLVYAPILGTQRLGLHDRAAGTVVMRVVPSATKLSPTA